MFVLYLIHVRDSGGNFIVRNMLDIAHTSACTQARMQVRLGMSIHALD